MNMKITTAEGTARKVGRAALGLALAAVLWACESGDFAPKTAEPLERPRIIVEFAVAGEAAGGSVTAGGSGGGLRETADRILSRLDPSVRETARVFERLPLLALEVDEGTLIRLLRMPEVVSIAPDREVRIPKLPGTSPASQ